VPDLISYTIVEIAAGAVIEVILAHESEITTEKLTTALL
jgi:hypothetical protein